MVCHATGFVPKYECFPNGLFTCASETIRQAPCRVPFLTGFLLMMLSRCDNCLLILPSWLHITQILRLFFVNQSHDVKLLRLLGFCEHPHKRSFHDSTCSKSLAGVYNGCHCRRGSYSILKARAPTHSAHFMSLTFFFILSPARMSRSHCRPC